MIAGEKMLNWSELSGRSRQDSRVGRHRAQAGGDEVSPTWQERFGGGEGVRSTTAVVLMAAPRKSGLRGLPCWVVPVREALFSVWEGFVVHFSGSKFKLLYGPRRVGEEPLVRTVT